MNEYTSISLCTFFDIHARSLLAVLLPDWLVLFSVLSLPSVAGVAAYIGYRRGRLHCQQAVAADVPAVTPHDSAAWPFVTGSENIRWTELLKIIFHTTSDAVFVKDRQGKYILANEATVQFVGKSLDEILGHDDRNLFPPEQAAFLMRRDQEIMESGSLETGEEVLESAGEKRTYLAMKAPYRDSHGQVIGLVGISRDITLRKHAEEQMRRNAEALKVHQQLLAHAQTIADLGHWYWEPESGKVHWSPELYRRYGVNPETFVPSANNFFALVHPDDLPEVMASVDRVLEGADTLQYDARIVRPDGHVVWIQVIARAKRDSTGKVIRLEGIDQDITQRKELEQVINQTQKMEAIARLAGGIAHDFNNLLTVIKGYCELLMQPGQSQTGIDVQKSLREINKAGDRAARLTGQLLAFSRQVVVIPKQLDVNSVVRAAYDQLEHLLGERPLVQLTLADQLPPVLADALRLEHMIVNLIVSARDALPEGQPVRLTTQSVQFERPGEALDQQIRPGNYVVLSVGQSSAEVTLHECSRSQRTLFTDQTRALASGLGLSIVHGVACECGGYVGFESRPDHGILFHLLLPTSAIQTLPTALTTTAQFNAHHLNATARKHRFGEFSPTELD